MVANNAVNALDNLGLFKGILQKPSQSRPAIGLLDETYEFDYQKDIVQRVFMSLTFSCQSVKCELNLEYSEVFKLSKAQNNKWDDHHSVNATALWVKHCKKAFDDAFSFEYSAKAILKYRFWVFDKIKLSKSIQNDPDIFVNSEKFEGIGSHDRANASVTVTQGEGDQRSSTTTDQADLFGWNSGSLSKAQGKGHAVEAEGWPIALTNHRGFGSAEGNFVTFQDLTAENYRAFNPPKK
jgi:hypothetical protein